MLRRRKKVTPGPTGRKPMLLLWVIVAVCFLVLAVAAPWNRFVNNFFHPYFALSAKITGPLADASLLLHSKSDLARSVETLTRENFDLARRAADTEAVRRENQELRSLLSLQPPSGYRYLAAAITARDPWLWNDAFTIDRGTRDGVEPGLAVLAAEPGRNGNTVLVGVIESAGPHSSRVLTVLNPEFHISAALPESDTVGFLNAGQSSSWDGGTAALGFLPATRTFALNEPLYTTGFEPLIPEGILIGYLSAVEPAPLPFGNRLYRNGSVRPAADFSRLGTVMVAQVEPALP